MRFFKNKWACSIEIDRFYLKIVACTSIFVGSHSGIVIASNINEYINPYNRFTIGGNSSSVLLLGAKGDLLRNIPKDQLEDSDNSGMKIFKITGVNGHFSSLINEGRPRFYIYGWQGNNFKVNITYQFNNMDSKSLTCSYNLHTNPLAGHGFGYVGVSRPLVMLRYNLTSGDFPLQREVENSRDCNNLPNLSNGSITLSIIGNTSLYLHPSNLINRGDSNISLNNAFMGNVSRIEIPYIIKNNDHIIYKGKDIDIQNYKNDVKPILCSSTAHTSWHCPTTITPPSGTSEELIKQEANIFDKYYQNKGFGSCGSCHVGGGVDLALLGYTHKDISRRALSPHIDGHPIASGSYDPKMSDAEIVAKINDYIANLRKSYHITRGNELIDPDKFRAMQPRFLVLGTYDNNHTTCYPGLLGCNSTGIGLISNGVNPKDNNQLLQQYNRDLTFGAYISGQKFNINFSKDNAEGSALMIDLKLDQPQLQLLDHMGLFLMDPNYIHGNIKDMQRNSEEMALQLYKVNTQLLRIGIPFPKWGEDQFFTKNNQGQFDPTVTPSFDKMLPFEPQMNKDMNRWSTLQQNFVNNPGDMNNFWQLYNSLEYNVTSSNINSLIPSGIYDVKSFSTLAGFNFFNMVAQSSLLATWMLVNHSELLPSIAIDQPHITNSIYFNSEDIDTARYRNLAIDRIPFWRVGGYLVQNGSQHPFPGLYNWRICSNISSDCTMDIPRFVYSQTLNTGTPQESLLINNNSNIKADWQAMSRINDPSLNVSAAGNADSVGDYANKLLGGVGNNYPIESVFYTVSKVITDRAMNVNYKSNITNTTTGEGMWSSNRPYVILEHNYTEPNFWLLKTHPGMHVSNWCESLVGHLPSEQTKYICQYANIMLVNTYKMSIFNTLSALQAQNHEVFDRRQTYGAILELYGVLYDYYIMQKLIPISQDLYVSKSDISTLKLAVSKIHNLLALKDSSGSYIIPNIYTKSLQRINPVGNLQAYQPELSGTVNADGNIILGDDPSGPSMKSDLNIGEFSNTFEDVSNGVIPVPPSDCQTPLAPIVEGKSGDTMKLTWASVTGAISYNIYGYPGQSNLLATVSTLSYNDLSTKGKLGPFDYYLQAVCDHGSSNLSKVNHYNPTSR